MREATVCHLQRENSNGVEILLGKRSSLFCNGLWNGPGGKLDPGESIGTCLRREVKEEIGVVIDLKSARHYASVDFHYPTDTPNQYSWDWRVHYFTVRHWQGEPQIREGFSELRWFPLSALPFAEMVADQKIWLPMAWNAGQTRLLQAEIFYADREAKTVGKGTFSFLTPKS